MKSFATTVAIVVGSLFAAAVEAAPTAAGQQIRAVTAPVFHLYLQHSTDGKNTPVLAAEATASNFTIAGTIRDATTGSYLNLGTTTTSYKPVVFGTTANVTAWGLEGDTIVTTNASPWGRQLNFLACSTATTGSYSLYLQTGNDMPTGTSCTLQTLHLPCLC